MAGKPFAVGATPGAADLNNMAYVYDRATTLVDIVSLATEQTLYTKTITGGHLSTNRSLRLKITGDYLNNTAAGRTLTIRVKYGGTTMWGDATFSIVNSAVRRNVIWDIDLANLGATNSQLAAGTLWVSDAAAGSIAGFGQESGAAAANGSMEARPSGTAAVDSTVDQTFAVTVQHSLADANLSVRLKYARLELL